MGIVEEVGPEVTEVAAGDRVVIPFNISCGHCCMCGQGLQSQCETTQVREHGTGASLFGYTKLYGQVPGGQAEFLRVPFGTLRCRSRCPRGRRTTASSSSPTCCRPPGRRSSTRTCPTAARWSCSASGRSATWPAGSRSIAATGVIGVDLVPERLERVARPRRRGRRPQRARGRPAATSIREMTDGRGPDAVIDAVGMEAHGSPVAKLAQKVAGAPARRARRPS